MYYWKSLYGFKQFHIDICAVGVKCTQTAVGEMKLYPETKDSD